LNSIRHKLQNPNKILQIIGIPYSALLSVVFGMMVLSFPLGAYVMFQGDLGYDISFEYPLSELELFSSFSDVFPFEISIGDVFIALWLLYSVFVAIAIL